MDDEADVSCVNRAAEVLFWGRDTRDMRDFGDGTACVVMVIMSAVLVVST